MDTSKILRDFCLSQRCEDYLVNLIFNFKLEGIFIDIGAHDGLRFSNSYSFSQIGWKGICCKRYCRKIYGR